MKCGELGGRRKRFTAMGGEPVVVAKALLGQTLVRVVNGKRLAGRIVEVEAYLGAEDRAAHTFGGKRTARNEAMYLKGGHAYVYFTYGMHHCLNVVCGRRDEGVAVLIRALEPTEGVAEMRRNRGKTVKEAMLCRGPGNVAKALRISRMLNGVDMRKSDVLFIEETAKRMKKRGAFGAAARVGLNTKKSWPAGDARRWEKKRLRFFMKGSVCVSKMNRDENPFTRR